MKNGIPHIKYYQLLEWKDDNMDKFIEMYGERRLHEFSKKELIELYEKVILKN